MPCNALPLQEPAQSTVRGQNPDIQRRKRHNENENKQNETSENSDEEEHYWAHRLRHHHNQPREQNVAPPVTPETVPQLELDVEAEEFRIETPVQMLLDDDSTGNVTPGHDTQQVTQTVESADLPSTREPEPSDTQPRRSQRERRPKETMTEI